MKNTARFIAVRAAKFLKENGGHFEVEMNNGQRANVGTLLGAIGDYEGSRYVTRCIEGNLFAIMRLES